MVAVKTARACRTRAPAREIFRRVPLLMGDNEDGRGPRYARVRNTTTARVRVNCVYIHMCVYSPRVWQVASEREGGIRAERGAGGCIMCKIARRWEGRTCTRERN